MNVSRNSNNLYDILTLEISGCKIGTTNSQITPFNITGFTNNYRVKITVHDNYYYTDEIGLPMISGIPTDDIHTLFNNRRASNTDVISNNAKLIYDPSKTQAPTINTTYFSRQGGGWMQLGAFVFVFLYHL